MPLPRVLNDPISSIEMAVERADFHHAQRLPGAIEDQIEQIFGYILPDTTIKERAILVLDRAKDLADCLHPPKAPTERADAVRADALAAIAEFETSLMEAKPNGRAKALRAEW